MTTGPCMSVIRSADHNLTSMTGRYQRQKVPLVVRGISRGSTETEPLPPTDLDDPFSNFFSIYRDEYFSKDQRTPVTSGQSSPNELCRASNFGWATGNTTERSSLYSSYSWADDISWGDEYDRRASSNVRSMFEEIDTVLFAESGQSGQSSSLKASTRSAHLEKECQEWMSQFPHLRVSGVGMSPQQDLGFQVIPVDKPASPSQNELLLDLTESTDSPNSPDTQSLFITGKHMIAKMAPRTLSTTQGKDPSPSDPYAFLHEEVFAQDGYYEEIIALDYKTEDEIVSARHPHRARAARRGLPPLTPNACVRDSVVSMTFDMAWSEIVSWMRDIIRLYLDYILSENSKHSVPPLEIADLPLAESQLQNLPLESDGAPTRENSFAKLERRIPTAQSSVGGKRTQALAGVLTISTKALQSREKSILQDSVEPQSSREIARPGSSLNRLVHRPSSVKAMDQAMNRLSSARKGPARVRLAPLDRAKTPNTEEDHHQRKEMGNQILVGRRLQMFPERQQQQTTNNDRLSSPSYMFRSALPPIGLLESSDNITASPHSRIPQRNLKTYMANRASSALAEKDIRQPRERERSLIMPDNRPSTTHTFRSDTPFAVARRSSTPMGFSAARGSLQGSSNHVSSGPPGVSTLLKIAGNSIGNSQSQEVSLAHHHLDEDDEFQDLQHAHWGASGNPSTTLPIRRGRQIGLSSVVR